MKYSFVLTSLLATSSEVYAFPSLAAEHIAQLKREGKFPDLMEKRAFDAVKRAHGFDAQRQLVSNTGSHKFVAPDFEAGDQRGPCPGLNAAANHGYIDRSGVDTMDSILNGVMEAYGMSVDLAAFLALFGTVFDGNPISLSPGYSIGGPSPKRQNILDNAAGLLGSAQGLSGSHNKYESDSSPTRGDQYIYGDGFRVVTSQAQDYLNNIPTDPISSDTLYNNLFNFRIQRFNHSLENNAHFFFSPFAGVLVAPAGYSFPKAMMANHSAEFPEGYMDKDIFKSFFSLTGDDNAVVYTEGHERIPDNWYRRAFGDEYSIPGFLVDVLDYATRDTRLLNVGGNTNGPNTFTGVDTSDLTKGVFNFADLLEGNNLACFSLQIVQAAAPDVLGGGITDSAMFGELGQNILTALAGYNCPELREIDNSLYDKYPGYDKKQGAV